MVTGAITLVIVEEDKKVLQQILRQLAEILQCQLRHREATILYDFQKISYDQILETVLQASYHISMFYVWEECWILKEIRGVNCERRRSS